MISAASSVSSLRSMSRRSLQADQFELVQELGTGSFGVVFRATDKVTSEQLAIKKIDMENSDDDIDEIQKEISILAECNDPHITRYYGSFVHGYKLWILMEFLGGGSCLDLVKTTGNFSEGAIAYVCAEILKGLRYLHANGKIHRDIKAANILVSDTGDVKIADFGVAAQLSSNMSRRNTFVGTPFWMAPEVIGQETYTFSADIWSLGITAMELANGLPPLSHLHPMKVLFYIPKNSAPRLDERFSKDFRDFVAQCLQKNPLDRANVRSLLSHKFLKRASKNELIRKVHQLQALAVPKSVPSEPTIYLPNGHVSQDFSDDDDGEWDFGTLKATTLRLETPPSDIYMDESDSQSHSQSRSSRFSLDRDDSGIPQKIPSPSPEPETQLSQLKLNAPNLDPPRSNKSPSSGYRPQSSSMYSTERDFSGATDTLKDTVSDHRSALVKIFSHTATKFHDATLAEIADILKTEPITHQTENYIIKRIGKLAMDQQGNPGQDKTKKMDAVETILLKKWLADSHGKH